MEGGKVDVGGVFFSFYSYLFIYLFWKALNISAIVTQGRMPVDGGLGRGRQVPENRQTKP